MCKDRFMKSKEKENMRTMKKSFQMKTNHSNEIINQDLSPKTMFDQKKNSLYNLIKPLIEYIIKYI